MDTVIYTADLIVKRTRQTSNFDMCLENSAIESDVGKYKFEKTVFER